ncbi:MULTISPECIES: MliC family protein [Rahnella]|jgi:membrane-bound inhibitor of C-type lysozyme|uniref:MliC family protein n=1 Tax=Rahnella victoriana TaxID=1510570 RepID=A0ABS0DMV6_9GAMM|nr:MULTISPECIES: MliC family protein [Rahnella]PKB89590.1 lysozyme inhibitor [Ewingella americana]VTQ54455.1 Membrane-bound lysozyme inhibitor of C-type lysozyme precursor [Campylobacter jejuni]MBF7955226.1 MliC family protein [Rahnella victoriana]PBI78578.1 lysozyme inhibitor [Rahnella victoriana]TBX34919.1 lysozyme inhibitor [Rahnella victoriana]
MKKAIIASLAGLTLAGCSQFGHQTESPTTELHYQCGTLPLTVTLNKPAQQVDMVLDGEQLKLKQVEAASGTRYSDGRYTFWSKGNQAFVQRGENVIIDDCVQQ